MLNSDRMLGLQKETFKRIELLLQHTGKTFNECNDILKTSERHIAELDYTTKKRKGSAGTWLEELITGKRGDNKSKADDGIWDIKSTNLVKKGGKYAFPSDCGLYGYSLKENLRITIINYNEIQNIEYNDSGLYHKSKIIVCFYQQKKPLGESIFLGFGIIDLSSSGRQEILKEDYEVLQSVCRKGEAHLIGSAIAKGRYIDKHGDEKVQYGKLVKSYSSGSKGNMQKYYDQDRNSCDAKGRALYLFKAEILDLIEVLG